VNSAFIGFQAGVNAIGGSSNVCIGFQAGQTLTTGSSNVVIGSGADTATGQNGNVVVGQGAKGSVSNVGGNNTVLGMSTSAGSSSNVCIGNASIVGSGGGQSVVIGASSGVSGLTAAGLVAVGYQAAHANTSGVNTFIGFQSGYTATAANATTTGTGQTCLGWNTGQNVTSATAPNYITCLGYQAQAGANGAVAIGTDSSGTGASTSVANAIQLGTVNHTVYEAATNTSSGATASTPTFANGTAAQLGQTTKDAMVYLTVGTAGTAMTITIGPTSTPANTVVSSSVATSGEVYAIRLPAGWYLEWADTTGTIANQLAVTC
jgi:hypothetical protein